MCYFLSVPIDRDPRYSIPPSYTPALFSPAYLLPHPSPPLPSPFPLPSKFSPVPTTIYPPLTTYYTLSPHIGIESITLQYIERLYSADIHRINPPSALSTSTKVLSHLPFRLCHGSLPVSRLATWSWNPLKSWPMWGATTQDSVLKSKTYWTTALN